MKGSFVRVPLKLKGQVDSENERISDRQVRLSAGEVFVKASIQRDQFGCARFRLFDRFAFSSDAHSRQTAVQVRKASVRSVLCFAGGHS